MKKEKSQIEEEFGEHIVPMCVKRKRRYESYDPYDEMDGDEYEEHARSWEEPLY